MARMPSNAKENAQAISTQFKPSLQVAVAMVAYQHFASYGCPGGLARIEPSAAFGGGGGRRALTRRLAKRSNCSLGSPPVLPRSQPHATANRAKEMTRAPSDGYTAE